jgi:hypothetical protein
LCKEKIMNDKFDNLMYDAGITAQGCWDEMDEYDRAAVMRLCELVVQECARCCGSQADQRNIRRRFGLPVEHNVQFPGPDAHWSVTSQYDRDYNLPK